MNTHNISSYATRAGDRHPFIFKAPTTYQPEGSKRSLRPAPLSRVLLKADGTPRVTPWGETEKTTGHPLQFVAYNAAGEELATGTAPMGNDEAILQDLLLQWKASHFMFSVRPELESQEPPRTYTLRDGWELSREDKAALSDYEPDEHDLDEREATPAF